MIPVPAFVGRVAELAEEFSRNAPVAQMFAKQGLDASFSSSMAEALSREANAQVVCLGSADVVEGITAFVEKRDPTFEGR